MLGGSGLKEEEDIFAFDVPFTYEGRSVYDKDFFEANAEGIVKSPVLCYSSAHCVKGEGDVLSFVRQPFFSRTYEKYCSRLV